MSRVSAAVVALAALVAVGSARALRAQEVERPFCDDALPRNNCPGADCLCVDDRIEVAFPLLGVIHTSIFRYRQFEEGARIDVEIVLDVESSPLQAFSYGVRHDPAFLELIPASLDTSGTVLDPAPGGVLDQGLNELIAVEGGFLHAVILSLVDPTVSLPRARHVVARASYRLRADAGLEGTRIRIVDDLRQGAADPLDIVLSIGARTRQPRVLSDGIVRRIDIPPEICDNGVDDDGDRLVDHDDPECQECVCEPVPEECFDYAFYFGDSSEVGTVDAVGQASFAISTRNELPLLGFQLGARRVDNGPTFTYQFSSDLGTDRERLVELLMTDLAGDSQTPRAGNQVTTSPVPVRAIRRGEATRQLSPGDFLEFDLEPGAGGPGFFLGYVSDLDGDEGQIPATGAGFGRSCPLNQVLIVDVEAPAGECPAFAFYFGRAGTEDDVDARGATTFSISSTNARPLLGFQLGVATEVHQGGATYRFSNDLGTDKARLVEVLMTDRVGDSISPATPNRLLSDTARVVAITRGAATRGFTPGDFLAFDLEPGAGGPGFFVGYVSDLDGDENEIPSTQAGSCFLNELLVVQVEGGEIDCRDNALYFGRSPLPGQIEATGATDTSFAISSRNADPLLGFQLGVRSRGEGGKAIFEFSGELGTDRDRLVELLFTNDRGDSIVPATPNTLIANTAVVRRITRGAATAPFDGGDFLAFDLSPGVGGPGFFAGYVSDLDGDTNKIPATAIFAGPGASCPLNELLIVELDLEPKDCVPADFAVFFGDSPLADTLDARGAETLSIASRNASGLFGFQFGVALATAGGETTLAFTDALGTDEQRLVEVLLTDTNGDSIDPLELNDAVTDAAAVGGLRRGAAIAGFEGGDFFQFDLDPGTGRGFFVGYVSDLDGDTNRIPATTGDECDANQLVVVELAREVRFFRGDADGDDRVNVSDAVLILQALASTLPRRFDCADLFDTDDDGRLLLTDGIYLLNWKFRAGPALPEPFFGCGVDPTDDGLDCRQSNCAGI